MRTFLLTARSLFTALALTALLLPGCAIDETSNPTPRCETDGECPAGRVCYRNFCIVGGTIDGGDVGMDAGADAGRDTAGCDGVSEEVCNGVDDDCDGTVDNIRTTTCASGELGLCATAHLVCPPDRGATPICRRDAPPAPETCNGMDDDCDGTTDEESARRCYPEGEMGCTLVAGRYICRGACGAGVQACTDGAYGACEQARTPGAEVCTLAGDVAGDEDCDEMIDEECTCTAGTSCFPGDIRQADLGECNVGTLDCGTHLCTGFGMPSDETCGNPSADNDCDGTEDNVPGTNQVCLNDDAVGVCHTGVTQCVTDGAVECVTPMSMTETCDGTDDDCDGMIDETFDTTTDETNCGACGETCAGGLSCCDGTCIDASREDDFCSMVVGTCGAACADGDSCCAGGCADTDSDVDNCGACGNTCNAGDLCCGGVCLNDDYDEANCGLCGRTCDGTTPDCCSGSCSAAGTCDILPADCTALSLDFCSGACFDTDTDENHCGDCTTSCGTGQVCCAGSCVGSDPTHCGGSCTDCGSDLCCNGACVPNNNAHCGTCAATCGAGLECCGTSCSTRNTDTNCGTCGNACADGQSCSVGHCCADGSAWCGGACLNVQTDRANCGACGVRCSNGLLGIGYENCIAGDCI